MILILTATNTLSNMIAICNIIVTLLTLAIASSTNTINSTNSNSTNSTLYYNYNIIVTRHMADI